MVCWNTGKLLCWFCVLKLYETYFINFNTYFGEGFKIHYIQGHSSINKNDFIFQYRCILFLIFLILKYSWMSGLLLDGSGLVMGYTLGKTSPPSPSSWQLPVTPWLEVGLHQPSSPCKDTFGWVFARSWLCRHNHGELTYEAALLCLKHSFFVVISHRWFLHSFYPLLCNDLWACGRKFVVQQWG